ncbi:MAG: hypothetical protein M1275_01455, partial [Patescibacteria group bacterium]|nr:hypothetical protein [Patescibacteria group bacterium]
MRAHTVKILVKESNVNFLNWYTLAEGFHQPVFKKYVGRVLSNWLIYIKNDSGLWGVPEKEWILAGESFARRFQAGKIDIHEI